MSTSKLMLKGSVLQTIEALVAIAIGFITLPLMQSSLGGELYGVWILIGGFTAMLYIFDFGFASSIIQSVSSSVALKDHKRTNTVINTALLIYTILSIIILLAVSIVAIFYRPNVDVSHVIARDELSWVIFIVGFSIAIEFPFKALAGLPQAYLRFDKGAIYKILAKVIGFIGTVILLHYGFKLVAIAIWALVMSVFSNILFLALAREVFKELKISSSYVDIKFMKPLFSYSAWSFLIDVNNLVKGRIDLFFIAGYVSLSAVSIYYVPVRLVEYALQLLFKALNLGLPILTANASQGDTEKFDENLLMFNRINVYFATLTFLFFLLFGKTIIYYWMGAEFNYQEAYQILLILMGGRLASLAANGYVTALYAKALHHRFAYNNIAETIFTSILLYLTLVVYNMGVLGAAISVALPVFCSRILLVPLLSLKIIGVKNAPRMFFLSYRPILLLALIVPLFFMFSPSLTVGINHLILIIAPAILLAVFMCLDIRPNELQLIKTLAPKIMTGRKNNV